MDKVKLTNNLNILQKQFASENLTFQVYIVYMCIDAAENYVHCDS